jgi:hypothetical protein
MIELVMIVIIRNRIFNIIQGYMKTSYKYSRIMASSTFTCKTGRAVQDFYKTSYSHIWHIHTLYIHTWYSHIHTFYTFSHNIHTFYTYSHFTHLTFPHFTHSSLLYLPINACILLSLPHTHPHIFPLTHKISCNLHSSQIPFSSSWIQFRNLNLAHNTHYYRIYKRTSTCITNTFTHPENNWGQI